MRTFKLQVQTTVDGYLAGPNGEMDWMTLPWTDDLNTYVDALSEKVDCIVLGRKLAEGFIPAWAAGPEGEDQASIDQMNNTPKVVVSNTLTESPWDNAVVAGGDVAEIVNKLKAQPGGDMIAYGGGTLVSSLIAKRARSDRSPTNLVRKWLLGSQSCARNRQITSQGRGRPSIVVGTPRAIGHSGNVASGAVRCPDPDDAGSRRGESRPREAT